MEPHIHMHVRQKVLTIFLSKYSYKLCVSVAVDTHTASPNNKQQSYFCPIRCEYLETMKRAMGVKSIRIPFIRFAANTYKFLLFFST